MSILQDLDGPFPFGRTDLAADRLTVGARHTVAHFVRWRDRNQDAIAGHVDRYTRHLETLVPRSGLASAVRYRVLPRSRRRERYREIAREVNYFGVFNLGEVPDPALVAAIVDGFGGRVPSVTGILADLDGHRGAAGVVESLERHLPVLAEVPDTRWLGERLDRLHRILPESVVRAGGMGKAVRALAGVLVIGAFDTLDADPAARREHLARIVPAAYALGAAYVIVDDTLQDLPGGHVSPADRDWCHRAILHGLTTGEAVDVVGMPDHPVAEELHELYGMLRESHPFAEHRHLYQAAEAMYLAQHRDAARTVADVEAGGLAAMYPDLLVKAGVSRVVANAVGRRRLPDGALARCLNTILLGQFRDDLRDRDEDRDAGRVTPFTVPPDLLDADPLHDLFAYDAYVASEVFGGDPTAAETLVSVGAVKLANHLSADPGRAEELLRD
ncbi:MAG: hypothetical protein GXX79_18800 [Actinomycetales bacterium]|nr:hypothetical protein [Actinomycetales bacterium]